MQKSLQMQNLVQNSVQKHFADDGAEPFAEANAAPAGRPVYSGCGANLSCSSIGATCKEVEQVAPMELKRRADDYAECRADTYADAHAESFAECRAVIRTETGCGSGRCCHLCRQRGGRLAR